jgi:hypothetical protein
VSPDIGHPPPDNQDLQFDKAEFNSGVPLLPCTACGKALGEYYFEANGKTLCGDCKQKVEARFSGGFKPTHFLRAVAAGFLAALLDYLLYFIIKVTTGYEFGLVAILVGFMVGVAVRWGSGGSGGWLYQLLALFFTYNAIVLTYVPMDAGEWIDHPGSLFVQAYGLPFMMGSQNIFGLIILSFGLYQAWKINKKRLIDVNGPYRASPPQTPPLAP